jgi:hypothetical protein
VLAESLPTEKTAATGNPGWKAGAVMAAGEGTVVGNNPKNTEGKLQAFVYCAS